MVVKAALSAIPFAGGPVADFMAYVIEPPLSKRRAEWEQSVTEKLNELEDKVEGFNVKELVEDESFVTAYVNATRLAISEHRKEKLDALRNAVLNTALPSSPEDDRLALFFNYIDRLTPWHLRILDYFGGNYAHGTDLTLYMREMVGREAFYGLLVDDLITCGLLYEDTESLPQDYFGDMYEEDEEEGLKVRKRYSSGNPKSARTLINERIRLKVSRAHITELGRTFLSFITSPIPTEDKEEE